MDTHPSIRIRNSCQIIHGRRFIPRDHLYTLVLYKNAHVNRVDFLFYIPRGGNIYFLREVLTSTGMTKMSELRVGDLVQTTAGTLVWNILSRGGNEI